MYPPTMPPRTLSSLRENADRFIGINAHKEKNSTVTRTVTLRGASDIMDDEIRTILGIPEELSVDTTIWSHGCDTCGYGYTVEVGLPYEVIIDAPERDPKP